jgi:glyoxylase-like metal-dependent hydrolase (beta-lactamase superfamily II)
VSAGAGDLPAIRGQLRRPQRHAAAGDVTRLGRLLGLVAAPGYPVPDASALDESASGDYTGGIQIVAAPGHTPGSVAFLLAGRGVLLAGDAVTTVPRLWRGPRALHSALREHPATLRRLAALDFDILAVGHGPPVVRDARQRLAALSG